MVPILVLLVALVVLFWGVRALIPQISPRPTNLGVRDGQLVACPDTLNCVSTQADQSQAQMPPIPYTGTVAEAKTRLLRVLGAMPKATVITNEPDYVYAEFRSSLWEFIDDVEFYFDDTAKVIHFRSASRLGRSDFGVNRQRMETITQRFNAG